jgi:hypothetical protein
LGLSVGGGMVGGVGGISGWWVGPVGLVVGWQRAAAISVIRSV